MKQLSIALLAFLLCAFPAQSQTKTKNNEAILNEVRAAIQKKSNDKAALFRGAKTLFQNNLFADCVKIADSLVALDASYYLAYSIRLKCRNELKNYVGALEDGIRAVELMPLTQDFGGNNLQLSIPISNLDEFPIIYTIVRQHLKNDKNIFKYYERLIDLFEAKAQDTLEMTSRRIMNERDSSFSRITVNRIHAKLGLLLEECARLYDQKGQPDKAEEILEHLVQTYPRWQGYTRRAAYFVSKKRYGDAVYDITKSLTLAHPERFQSDRLIIAAAVPPYAQWRGETLRWRGDQYVRLKKFDLAIADFEAAKSDFAQLVPNPAKSDIDRAIIAKFLSGIDQKISAAKQLAKKSPSKK